jgi:hypothetical protein
VITFTNCAYATDGGSLSLFGTEDGSEVALFLDRSVARQLSRSIQLFVNGEPILRGSPEEAAILQQLRNATFAGEFATSVEEYARMIIDHLTTPTFDEQLDAHVAAGRWTEAIQLYRKRHPDVGVSAARAELEKRRSR